MHLDMGFPRCLIGGCGTQKSKGTDESFLRFRKDDLSSLLFSHSLPSDTYPLDDSLKTREIKYIRLGASPHPQTLAIPEMRGN